MANICQNTFYAVSNDINNINYINNFFDSHLVYYDSGYIEDDCVEVYFDSKWTFPREMMQELIDGIPNRDDIYMRCLSVEYGCEYVEFNKWEGNTDNWINIV